MVDNFMVEEGELFGATANWSACMYVWYRVVSSTRAAHRSVAFVWCEIIMSGSIDRELPFFGHIFLVY